MEHVNLNERFEKDDFARRAAQYFAENPKKTSYTDGEIETECYFALRYGLENDGVVVFKICDSERVTNYMEIIPKW